MLTGYQWVIVAAGAFLSVVVGLSLVSSFARIESLDANGVQLVTLIGRSVHLSWPDVKKVMWYQTYRRARLVLYLKRPPFLAFRSAYFVRLAAWDYPQQELAAQLPKYAEVSEYKV